MILGPPKAPAPVSPAERDKVIGDLRKGLIAVAIDAPEYILAYSRIVREIRVTRNVPTACIDTAGIVRVNPDFVAPLTPRQRGFLMAHEVLHALLRHLERMGGRDPGTWNRANDSIINSTLIADRIGDMITGGLTMPDDYTGLWESEALYDHLRASAPPPPPPPPPGGKGRKPPPGGGPGRPPPPGSSPGDDDGDDGDQESDQPGGQPGDKPGKPRKGKGKGPGQPGDDGEPGEGEGEGEGEGSGTGDDAAKDQPTPGTGCGQIPADPDDLDPGSDQGTSGRRPGPLSESEAAQIAGEIRAMARSAGRGTSALADVLEPRPGRIDWRRVLRHAMTVASSAASPDHQTYAKASRRGQGGVIMPGWKSRQTRIAILIDVSGSMSREWAAIVIGETEKIMTDFPGLRVYAIAHTSEVVGEAWVGLDPAGTESMKRIMSNTGGTDFHEAYERAGKAGVWDAILHFTDCEVGGAWPAIPGRARLIVGAFGSGAREETRTCKPPHNAEVIPMEVPEDRR